MSRYVDPLYIINNLCDIFNDNLGITLKDVYDVIETAPSIEIKNLENCNCSNCIYSYSLTFVQEDNKTTTIQNICDCEKSLKYGKPINLSQVCTEWEGE